jgi:predicted transcriptional regulator
MSSYENLNLEINKETLRKIITDEVLRRKNKEDKEYMLTSNDANWIFDFRNAFLKPQYLQIFAQFFWKEM